MDAATKPRPGNNPSQPGQQVLLSAQGVGVEREGGWVLRNLNLSLAAGSVLALVGPMGSGHSRALLALAGRHRLNEGTLKTVDGELGVIGWFADLDLLDEHARVIATLTEVVTTFGGDTEKIPWALETVGLTARQDSFISALTIDERVLLGIAWCYLSDARIVSLEATSALSFNSPVWKHTRALANAGRLVLIGTALANPPAETIVRIPEEAPR